ncbi:MAG: diguanylate cyclase [Burkholderiaceae bacterium]|nr:diguanylate cyclase [Burkholderiaceae bacterium]
MDADLFFDDSAPAPASTRWQRLRQALTGWQMPPWLGSLKLRLMVGSLAALLLSLLGVTALMAYHAEQGILAQAQARSASEVAHAAEQVGQSLDRMLDQLSRFAGSVPASAWDDQDRLAATLAREVLPQSPMSSVFAGVPGRGSWAYADTAGTRRLETQADDLAVVQPAVDTGRPMLSPPLQGRISGEPVVVLVHPVRREGRVVGVIGGTLRLASRDIRASLQSLPSSLQGEGWFLTDGAGRLLAHATRERVAGSMVDDAGLSAAWQHLQQTGSSRAPMAWDDGATLHAVATVPGHGWLVWTHTTRAELLAPLHQARHWVLLEAALLACGFTLVLGAFLRWQLRPLHRLERHARAMLAGETRGDWPQADGEIGRLARTLHHLWAERTQMESFNAQVLQKLGSVMAAAPVGLAFTRNQSFELVSEELCRLLGRHQDDILGQRTQTIFASNEDYAALGPMVAAAFAGGQPYSGEWPMLRADGSRFWGLLRARPVAPEDPAAGTIWSLNDVSEQVAARRQLEHAAHHDALTGVVNRQGFEGALQALFDAQPGSRPASLVMIDLDHFKPINDTAGHAAGDAMLVAVAQAIGSRVRATDIVVRLGGDEFALLLPHCPHERALGVAEKVREAIADLALTWEAHTLRVGASLGVAELGEHHESAAQWMAQADAACYEAKRQGRGRVRLARPELKVMQGGR